MIPSRQAELAAFLRAARSRLRPQDVGLSGGDRRRTPGLRRQEVAELAAVSVDWYVRLEQGRVGTPGTGVLDGIAEALLLSPTERAHLHLIARGEAPPIAHAPVPVSDSLLAILAGMPRLPAYVIDFRFDVLARNDAALAMFGAGFGTGASTNAARMLFEGEKVRSEQLDWERVARETVGNLRGNLARHRDDPPLRALIADLKATSPEFAAWWDDQHVQERTHGTKRIVHPAAGLMTVSYDLLGVDGSDQRLMVLTPFDDSTEQALRTLTRAHAVANVRAAS